MNRITEGVIEAIASHRGVDPLELTTPLHTVIDADALNGLYRRDTAGPSPTVAFFYEGERVIVDGPNEITIQEAPDPIP